MSLIKVEYFMNSSKEDNMHDASKVEELCEEFGLEYGCEDFEKAWKWAFHEVCFIIEVDTVTAEHKILEVRYGDQVLVAND